MAISARLARRVRHGISRVSVVRLSTSSDPIVTACNTGWNVGATGTSATKGLRVKRMRPN